jgi:hypothetical protein
LEVQHEPVLPDDPWVPLHFRRDISLTSGNRQQATIGFILGGMLIVGNDWWQWRKRQ